MGVGGGPSPPPFSAAGIHRKTHEKRAFQGIKQQKKRLRSCASATISERGHVLRLPVCARSGCGGRGGGQSQTEQSSRPTGKQKSTRKARNCVFPVLYGKPFSVGTLCPFSIAHQNRNVKYTMQRSPVWLLCTRQEPKSCTSTACTLWACLTSPRVYDRVIFIQTPPLSFGAGVVLTPPGCLSG